ncbi:MAG: DUF1801 domain-containing protein [Saprospiraceae bacterium]
MQIQATSPEDYIAKLPEDRKAAIITLRKTILDNLPAGFSETINYGMIGYVIPHGLYPAGYHCDPQQPLPFMGMASQKNFVAFYHMGLYASPELTEWFVSQYPKYSKARLDMGKSCIRFKKMDQIPFALLGELVGKINAQQWIETYEQTMKK